MKNILRSFLLCAALLTGTSSYAQITMLTPQNLGMGGGGTAYIGDFNAMYINPANMLLNPRKTTVSLGIAPNIGVHLGGPFVGIGDYNKYFTGGSRLDAATTEEFLTTVFGTDENAQISVNSNIDIVPFGLSMRFGKLAVGLGLRSRVITSGGFSRGATQLMLRGLDYESFEVPRGVDMTVSALNIVEASAAFAFEVMSFESTNPFLNGRLIVGVAPKYVISNLYTRVNVDSDLQIFRTGNYVDSMAHNFNITVETVGEVADGMRDYVDSRNDPNSDMKLSDAFDINPASLANPAATTVGMDVGITYEANLENLGFLVSKKKFLRLGVSVTDIGQLDFSKGGAGQFSSSGRYTWKGLVFDQERIDEEFNGETSDYIDHVLQDSVGRGIYGDFQEDIYSPIVNLPTSLNAGAYLAIGRLGLAFDYSQSLYRLGTSVVGPSISLGAEWRVMDRWFPLVLRGGTRFGGITPAAYSFGTGLSYRNIELSFSTMAFSGDGGEGMYFGFAMTGLMLRF